MTNKVAKYLKYGGVIFKYSHAKHNILIYIIQPQRYYDDWEDDGEILVVEYHPNSNNNKYIVLHNLSANSRGYISHHDISHRDKIAQPLSELDLYREKL